MRGNYIRTEPYEPPLVEIRNQNYKPIIANYI